MRRLLCVCMTEYVTCVYVSLCVYTCTCMCLCVCMQWSLHEEASVRLYDWNVMCTCVCVSLCVYTHMSASVRVHAVVFA